MILLTWNILHYILCVLSQKTTNEVYSISRNGCKQVIRKVKIHLWNVQHRFLLGVASKRWTSGQHDIRQHPNTPASNTPFTTTTHHSTFMITFDTNSHLALICTKLSPYFHRYDGTNLSTASHRFINFTLKLWFGHQLNSYGFDYQHGTNVPVLLLSTHIIRYQYGDAAPHGGSCMPPETNDNLQLHTWVYHMTNKGSHCTEPALLLEPKLKSTTESSLFVNISNNANNKIAEIYKIFLNTLLILNGARVWHQSEN